MNSDLLTLLAQAQTDDERAWLVTESLLHTLSPELQSAVWAVAIPHWFDAEILTALRPDLADQAEDLYGQLQQLSFVEVFPGRGHNIHERTRKGLLNQLWTREQEEFRQLSAHAAQYFLGDSLEHLPGQQIEAIYHQVMASPEDGDDRFWDLAQTWNNDFRLVELESLLDTLREHIAAQRLEPLRVAKELYWRGKARSRAYRNDEALANYEQAIGLFRDVGDRLGEANTLKAIGDVLQFLNRRDEALANYEQAIGLFRDVGDRLGEANTLQGLGGLKENDADALALYRQAHQLYQQIGDQYSQARNLRWFMAEAQVKLGQVADARIALQEAADIFDTIGLEDYRDGALGQIEELQ